MEIDDEEGENEQEIDSQVEEDLEALYGIEDESMEDENENEKSDSESDISDDLNPDK